jgi:hypothetical protein
MANKISVCIYNIPTKSEIFPRYFSICCLKFSRSSIYNSKYIHQYTEYKELISFKIYNFGWSKIRSSISVGYLLNAKRHQHYDKHRWLIIKIVQGQYWSTSFLPVLGWSKRVNRVLFNFSWSPARESGVWSCVSCSRKSNSFAPIDDSSFIK